MSCMVFTYVRIQIHGRQRQGGTTRCGKKKWWRSFWIRSGIHSRYFEIEINPLNTVTDLFIRRTWTGLKKDFRLEMRRVGHSLRHLGVRLDGSVPNSICVSWRLPSDTLSDLASELFADRSTERPAA